VRGAGVDLVNRFGVTVGAGINDERLLELGDDIAARGLIFLGDTGRATVEGLVLTFCGLRTAVEGLGLTFCGLRKFPPGALLGRGLAEGA